MYFGVENGEATEERYSVSRLPQQHLEATTGISYSRSASQMKLLVAFLCVVKDPPGCPVLKQLPRGPST